MCQMAVCLAVGAWGAAEAEADAAGGEGLEHAELFGDNERRVVGEHHTPPEDTGSTIRVPESELA